MPSVVKVTDENGNVVATREYNAFGEVLSETGNWSHHRFGFHPNWIQLKDVDGGRFYLTPGGRIYDTKDGRFLQRDPKARPGENPYVAFLNNPMRFVDPTGAAEVDVTKKGQVDEDKPLDVESTTSLGEFGEITWSKPVKRDQELGSWPQREIRFLPGKGCTCDEAEWYQVCRRFKVKWVGQIGSREAKPGELREEPEDEPPPSKVQGWRADFFGLIGQERPTTSRTRPGEKGWRTRDYPSRANVFFEGWAGLCCTKGGLKGKWLVFAKFGYGPTWEEGTLFEANKAEKDPPAEFIDALKKGQEWWNKHPQKKGKPQLQIECLGNGQ